MNDSKITLVLGASENEERYSNKAVRSLRKHRHAVIAIGNKAGQIEDVKIETATDANPHPDTVTLYLNPMLQKNYYTQILDWKPRRIIFNPGTENDELKTLAEKNGIETTEACTLVLLSTNQY